MLATVLSNRSAAVDGNGEEQDWRRVIRVPVTCVSTAQEASTLPPRPQTLRSAFAAVSQPFMSEARSGLSDTLNQTYMTLSSPQSELQMHRCELMPDLHCFCPEHPGCGAALCGHRNMPTARAPQGDTGPLLIRRRVGL